MSKEMSNVFLWRNNRFVGKAIGSGGKIRHVSAGINGQGDISGVIAPGGRRLEIEIKADYQHGRDRQTPIQEAFQRRLESMGAIYLLVERVGWGADGKPDLSVVIKQLRNVE